MTPELEALPKGPVMQRRVVCAASRYGEHIILGPRHGHALMHAHARAIFGGEGYGKMLKEQGFIDQHGVFMTRQEAWKVAEAAGQIIARCGGDAIDGGYLFSENLY